MDKTKTGENPRKTAAYWLWLQHSMGAGANTADMFSAFDSAVQVWEASANARALSAAFTPRQLLAMRECNPKDFAPMIRSAAAKGWWILTPESPEYPALLRTITNAPLALFCHGDISILSHPMPLGVVGTRNASYRSRKIANRLCVSLTGAGALIVSGGALGVDSAAHEGALMGLGKTVAVLGAGLDSNYLSENAPLRKRIAENGVLITEFPMGTQVVPRNFPIRNRIISGMSRGVLVIEAGERSGSLITAGFALEQGRDVFVVPGDISESGNNGSNKLIREGAKPIFSAYDVLEDYNLRFPGLVDMERADTVLERAPEYIPPKENPKKKRIKTGKKAEKISPKKPYTQEKMETVSLAKCPDECTENAKRVFAVLGEDALGADDISRACALPVNDVLAAVTELELFGAARREAGNRFRIG
ncbi:MAG: DNA-processing protein DprA [Oscillospiraceae bacterium]|nr:DNA-processing protein DprA [Oscillospiraceae bacterium]